MKALLSTTTNYSTVTCAANPAQFGMRTPRTVRMSTESELESQTTLTASFVDFTAPDLTLTSRKLQRKCHKKKTKNAKQRSHCEDLVLFETVLCRNDAVKFTKVRSEHDKPFCQ